MSRAFRRALRLVLSVVVVGAVLAELSVGQLSGASVIPPTFKELVAEALVVFVARATEKHAVWVFTPQQRSIVTDVTFAVESTLKGEARSSRTLRFIGGTLDGRTLAVPGIPQFDVGDRAVLFVESDRASASPLVGMMHGRFSVQRAVDGRDYVTLHDGRAFATVEQVGPAALTASRAPIRPYRLEDFEREVSLELARSSR